MALAEPLHPGPGAPVRLAARVRLATAVALAATLAAAPARADDTHYQDILVGGRAVGLGGAFTSIADDPSGPYFNPAGLADARSTNLQVSTSLYGFERGESPKGLVSPVPGVDNLRVQFTDLIIIPASAGFVQTFGPLDGEGRPYQAYGISVVVPSYRSFGQSQDVPSENGVSSYQRRVTDRELWTGIGYGRRVTPDLRLGVSGYYILRSVTDREHVTSSETLPGGMGDKFDSVTDDISFINGNILFVAGARYTPAPHWAVGLSVSSPSIPIHSQLQLAFSRAAADPTSTSGPQATLDNLSFSGTSQQKFSPVVRLGASYVQEYRFTLSADVSYHAPTSYSLISPSAAERAQFDEYRSRLPFNPEIDRRQVVNFNVGGEFLLVREVSIGGGFFTDFSSAPRIPANPSHDQPADVDLYGMSMAIGYFGEHTLSRLGVMYSFGTGSDVTPNTGDVGRVLQGDQGFNRVPYFQSFFYVFLSSTFRY